MRFQLAGLFLVLASIGLSLLPDAQSIDPTRTYSIPNPGFQHDLTSWNFNPQAVASVWDKSTDVAKEGTRSCKAVVGSTGLTGAIWNSISINGPPPLSKMTPKFFGEKVMSGIWFYLGSVTTNGNITVKISSWSGTTNTTIAQQIFSTSAMPLGKWIYLQPIPVQVSVQGDAGRPRGDAISVTFSVEFSSFAGVFYVDALQAGRFEYTEYALLNNSFETVTGTGPTSWQAGAGVVSASEPAEDTFSNPAYYGTRYGTLTVVQPNGGQANTYQDLTITNTLDSPKHGDIPQASVWFRRPSGGFGGAVSVTILERTASGQSATLATKSVTPPSHSWTFVQTPTSAQPIPFQIGGNDVTKIRVQIKSTLNGTVWIDFSQVGQRYATNGNPKKFIFADVEMSYRAQHPNDIAKLGYGTGANEVFDALPNRDRNWLLGRIFGNWAGFHLAVGCTVPAGAPTWPSCGPPGTYYFWQHDPSLIFREDLCDRRQTTDHYRLDVATTIDNPTSVVGGAIASAGLHDLPLTGAYSSFDQGLVRWQISMAKAAGVDAFSLELLGHALAVQSWASPSYFPFGLDDPMNEFWWANDDTTTPAPVPPPGVDWPGMDATHPLCPRSEIAQEAMWDIADTTDFKLFPYLVIPGAYSNGADFEVVQGQLSCVGHAGWIQKGPTTIIDDPDEQVETIEYDIARCVQYYYDRKPTLKINGAMVIGIFWQDTRLYDCTSLEARWPEIIAEVNGHLPQGRKVVLIGTSIKTAPCPENENYVANTLSPDFESIAPCLLLDDGFCGTEPTSFLHKYKTFDDFVAGTPLDHPADNPNLDWNVKATEVAQDLAWRATQWAAVDDTKRMPLGFIYPDFDNSGAETTRLADSATLGEQVCIHVMSDHVEDMLGKTFDASIQAGIDWIQLGTWNGWNEWTRVEPLWDFDYWNASQQIAPGAFDPDLDPRTYFTGTQAEKDAQYNRIFDRVLRLQELIGGYKGITLDATQFYKITGRYLHDQATGAATLFY